MNKLAIPLLLLAVSVTGCTSSGPKQDAVEKPAPMAKEDPLENVNKGVYRFNSSIDKSLLKPVAVGYDKATDGPVRRGMSNFFQNLSEPRVIVNSMLQGKLGQGMTSMARFVINSTAGIGGLVDVAGLSGAPYKNEDFGQTLAVWGWTDASYVMLPILGPSNVRDSIGQVVDFFSYPLLYYNNTGVRNSLYVLKIVDARANALAATDILNEAAGDKDYEFVREAYRQHRKSEIADGEPKLEGLEFIEDN